jgi:hypothetical protein
LGISLLRTSQRIDMNSIITGAYCAPTDRRKERSRKGGRLLPSPQSHTSRAAPAQLPLALRPWVPPPPRCAGAAFVVLAFAAGRGGERLGRVTACPAAAAATAAGAAERLSRPGGKRVLDETFFASNRTSQAWITCRA